MNKIKTLSIDISNAGLVFFCSSFLFLGMLQFMPHLFANWAKALSFSPLFYDLVGFLGLTIVIMTVISLQSGIYGTKADKNPWFIGVNSFGALMHLLSFGGYPNPNGIVLDSLIVIIGIYGMLSLLFYKEKPIPETTPVSQEPPSLKKIFLVVGSTQLLFMLIVWKIWPSVIVFVSNLSISEQFFKDVGTISSIAIVSCFFGQMLGLIKAQSWIYKFMYTSGVLGYMINLSVDPNFYTVSLLFLILRFLFFKIPK